jgi:hypothetical protein
LQPLAKEHKVIPLPDAVFAPLIDRDRRRHTSTPVEHSELHGEDRWPPDTGLIEREEVQSYDQATTLQPIAAQASDPVMSGRNKLGEQKIEVHDGLSSYSRKSLGSLDHGELHPSTAAGNANVQETRQMRGINLGSPVANLKIN